MDSEIKANKEQDSSSIKIGITKAGIIILILSLLASVVLIASGAVVSLGIGDTHSNGAIPPSADNDEQESDPITETIYVNNTKALSGSVYQQFRLSFRPTSSGYYSICLSEAHLRDVTPTYDYDSSVSKTIKYSSSFDYCYEVYLTANCTYYLEGWLMESSASVYITRK